MSQPENLQSELTSETTPNKPVEVTCATDFFVGNPIPKSSETAFLVNSIVPDFQSAEVTTFAETSTEEKFQSCNVEEGSLGDFPLLKKHQQVPDSDDINIVSPIASHQQQLDVMAEEQTHLAPAAASNVADSGGATLNLPENASENLKVNNLPIQNSGKAILELHEMKTPRVGKRGRTYKQKICLSPLGATEENSVPIVEHTGGVRVDGRMERSHMMRERKKSKYLLYPYIDSMDIPVAGNNETKELSNREPGIKSSTSLSEGSKNALDSGKSCCGLNGRDKARIKKLSSAELLCELRLAAQNGSCNIERKYCGPLKRFSSGFRRFTFLKHEDDSSQDLSESKLLAKRVKESSNCTGPEVHNGDDQMEYSSSCGKPKKLGRIADKTSRDIDFSCMLKNYPGIVHDASKSQAADQQLDVSNANMSTSFAEISMVTAYGAESGNGAVVRGCPGTVPDASKNQVANQQQMSKAVSGIAESSPMNGRLDLNPNISISSAEISQVTVCATSSNGSVERGCPGTVPDSSKCQATDHQQRSTVITGIAEANPMSRLLVLNANISTSSSEISKVTGYGAESVNGSVEGGHPGTFPDASKSQAAEKSKTVLSSTLANPISRLLDLNTNTSTCFTKISKITGYGAALGNGSMEWGCPGTVLDGSQSQAVDQQRKSKTVSSTTIAKSVSRLVGQNVNISTSSAKISKVTKCGAASGNLEEKNIKTGNVCTVNNPGLSGLNGNRMTFIQLLNGVQAGVPNLFQSNVQGNTTGTQTNTISNLKSRQSETEASQVESASLVKSSLESKSAPPGFIPQHGGERWQKPKIEAVNISDNEIAASASVMSDSVAESNSIRKYKEKASPGSVPGPEKRGRKRKEAALNIPNDRTVDESVLLEGSLVKKRRNSSESKVQKNVQQLAAIILNFTSGFPLPSVESIFETFAAYGIIHKPETRFINNSTAQVVFIQGACAEVAFRSLQKNNPFGPVIESYKLTHFSVATTDNNLHIQHPIQAMNQLNGLPAPPGMIPHEAMNQPHGLPAPPGMIPHEAMNQPHGRPAPPGMMTQNGEPPNLMFIKQKLEEMTSLMEKAGNNLSPDMRSKLESEIGRLQQKVNSMVGASS